MGNCVLKGSGERGDVVKVVTADGGIMELFTPITAECITGEYPGHAIFKSPSPSPSIFSEPPLLHIDQLHAGQVYYLLPLNPPGPGPTVVSTPYRMSTCHTTHNAEVWKVKLVISPQQLSHILSQHNRTEDLIDNVRTVAKCRNAARSDNSSVSGSSSSS